MNVAEKDYRIWKNKNFVIESTITIKLWDEILINDFPSLGNELVIEITFNLLSPVKLNLVVVYISLKDS